MKWRSTYHPNNPITQKLILASFVTRETIPGRDRLKNLAVNPVSQGIMYKTSYCYKVGYFNTAILLIYKFPKQEEFNWDPKHVFISKYHIQPFGHDSTIGGDLHDDGKIKFFHCMAPYIYIIKNLRCLREGSMHGVDWIFP